MKTTSTPYDCSAIRWKVRLAFNLGSFQRPPQIEFSSKRRKWVLRKVVHWICPVVKSNKKPFDSYLLIKNIFLAIIKDKEKCFICFGTRMARLVDRPRAIKYVTGRQKKRLCTIDDRTFVWGKTGKKWKLYGYPFYLLAS